jgi:hypothetical protein
VLVAGEPIADLKPEASEVEVLAWVLGSSAASILRNRLEMQDL